ncbi:MAG: Re/Si-specific NAD(P)(+) transhydrogenase subunit alpha [Planctomycetes bacterium]|nr:Re/Si-specific NAD(P)(+) transhydrogenase subunit alpha [Planctomycetota bacterium]
MAVIFVPKETEPGETRVAAIPETVKGMLKAGLKVQVERGAGLAAGFADADFASAGAELVDASARGQADLVLGIQTPNVEQCRAQKSGSILISSLTPTSRLSQVKALRDAKVSAMALELMPRITRAQKMDILSSQATVAGYQAVLLAAATLPKMFPLLMTAAGTITPARVLVLGAGVAGLQAISTARRLGAVVEANDIRPACKEQVESLGGKFVDTGAPPDAETKGGYAKETTAEFLRKQREILTSHITQADVLITTALVPGRKAPVLVTADMRKGMKPGSVIVDMAAGQGGNVEGSVSGQRVVVDGVTILGDTNLPAQCANDSSRMFARNVLAFLGEFVKNGQPNVDIKAEILAAVTVTHDGQVCHEATAQALAANPG